MSKAICKLNISRSYGALSKWLINTTHLLLMMMKFVSENTQIVGEKWCYVQVYLHVSIISAWFLLKFLFRNVLGCDRTFKLTTGLLSVCIIKQYTCACMYTTNKRFKSYLLSRLYDAVQIRVCMVVTESNAVVTPLLKAASYEQRKTNFGSSP